MSVKILPTDQNSFSIQTLGLGDTSTKIAVAVATARAAFPTGAGERDIVRLACNTDCYIAFGDSTVDATTSDALFTQGVEIFKIPMGATHLAAIRVSADGVLTITEVH